ncbi:hypothetical protein ACEYX6_09835 [Acinetobacter sp. c2-A9]|uniref:hypothetical protein n=1 Tax=Acinetobacter sp. c2-A9 TaxID=3342802 RepID=UPI0035B9FDBF
MLKSQDFPVIGITGEHNQRLIINIQSVKKINPQSFDYKITGYSKVKNNRCEFTGKLTLTDIYRREQLDYGVDEEYCQKGLINQGVAVFQYEINEQSDKTYCGQFAGSAYVKWLKLKSNNHIQYDDVGYYRDGDFNSLFDGQWFSQNHQ